jgi:pyridoxamine 5'-phosphate oxidase
MKSISDIRKEYTKSTLDTSTVAASPVDQFTQWFEEAIRTNVPEPNAMNLATISADGTPRSRIVLLKGVEGSAFVFYTNYQSQKGLELENNPACALTFFWPELERQVRITGVAEPVSAATSDQYFNSRPRASQIGAWSSPQSAVIASRGLLDLRVTEIEKRFKGKDVIPRPKQWGGYGVVPTSIEFWQGRAGRLHDRILYTFEKNVWKIVRLAP